jgi:hypothetical protein
MPASIPTSASCPGVGSSEICITDGSCSGYIDLSALTADGKYIVSVPFDPKSSTTNGTAYNIVKTANNRIIVCAPQAENGVTISVSK